MKQANSNETPFEKACRLAGGTARALAAKLTAGGYPVTPQAVGKWKEAIPPARAKQIEHVLGGAITRRELLPDLFEDLQAAG